MKYPSNGEHEYLWETIQLDYFADDDREVEPLYQQEHLAWNGDSDSEYEQAHQRRVEAQNRILERRRRREDIVYWLFLDTQLRMEGKTYSDVYEKTREVNSNDGNY